MLVANSEYKLEQVTSTWYEGNSSSTPVVQVSMRYNCRRSVRRSGNFIKSEECKIQYLGPSPGILPVIREYILILYMAILFYQKSSAANREQCTQISIKLLYKFI